MNLANLNIMGRNLQKETSRDFLKSIVTPQATSTWQPMGHFDVANRVATTLEQGGLEVVQELHAVTKNNPTIADGIRLFSLFQVFDKMRVDVDQVQLIGMTNVHDKSKSLSISAGQQVMICDNMQLNSELNMQHMHTKNVENMFAEMLSQLVGKFKNSVEVQAKRVNNYKEADICNSQANDIVIDACLQNVIPSSKIIPVIEQWQNPNHSAFKDRNAYSLQNAFTEVFKTLPTNSIQNRTNGLNNLLDSHFESNKYNAVSI